MKAKFGQIVREAFEAWGLRAPTSARSVSDARCVALFLAVGTQRVHVGTLRREGDEFVFRYTPEFRLRAELPPIPDFPDKEREYRMADLWPFFEQRIPPVERPDVEEVLRRRKMSPDSDRLLLLSELGRRALSSPYELELRPA